MRFAFPSSIGMILLAVYLILVGIVGIMPGLAFPPLIFGILALLAGIFILIGR